MLTDVREESTSTSSGELDDVIFRKADIDFTNNDLTVLEADIIGLNFKDGLDWSIEVFVVPELTINGIFAGFTGGDRTAPNLAGFLNSVFIVEAEVAPAMPCHSLGHEMGHILFDVDGSGHDSDPRNLFSGGVSPLFGCDTSITGPKRLSRDASNDQGALARTTSGPSTVPPILQRK